MVGVGDDRRRQPQFRFGKRGRIGERTEIGDGVVGGIETVGVDLAQIGDRRLGARIGLAVGDPQRRIVAGGVERIEVRPFLLAADDAVVFAVRQFAQLVADCGIGVDHGAGGRLAWRCWRADGGGRHLIPPGRGGRLRRRDGNLSGSGGGFGGRYSRRYSRVAGIRRRRGDRGRRFSRVAGVRRRRGERGWRFGRVAGIRRRRGYRGRRFRSGRGLYRRLIRLCNRGLWVVSRFVRLRRWCSRFAG